ncbi:uncharacterized protein Ecym_1036 [Eremothecium cymbalariae DBVPG|uniref:protein disulfide-isomerase n=1 Tax=Eremothecium cymbalariae (strain CBS 270.75 / DBVPG 7215 / KCTC 17166 / NRRL Y-17582) TaxID=931890 RepID=G8JM34_ERECY|nr:hypothetical protein Ecym_1036 [Eremothecium cymbalariae DBVPG\
MLFNKKVMLALASGLALCARAEEATAPEDSKVVKLGLEDFRSFLKEHSLVLAEFYAPWCGHCKRLGPEFVEAAAELVESEIYLAQIDCEKEKELCQEQSIGSYPTLKIFRNGEPELGTQYMGDRKASSIVSYMLKQNEPSVRVVQGNDAAEQFAKIVKESEDILVVDGGVSDLNETFHELAESHRHSYSFVQYPESDSKLGLYLQGEEEPIYYNGDNFTIDSLTAWLKVESLPYFGDVDASTFSSYRSSGLPVAYFFYTSPEERAEYEEFFVSLGKQYRGEIAFGGIDATKHGRFAESLSVKQQFPLFVIHKMFDNLKYSLPQLSDEEYEALTTPLTLDKKQVTEFIKKFIAGKLEPIIKSEEVPEVQENNVYKLVGKTHDDIISDKDKDVLVKYYAPWCGHCKTLAPVYEQLADLYASDEDSKDKILIADIDATLNDVQVEIQGFPTIILYPAGKDSEPVTFESQRSVEAFVKFIAENGAHKFDGKHLIKGNSGDAVTEDGVPAEEDLEHDEL